MKGFSDKYVESIIKRTIKGSMTIRDSAIRLGISRQYMYRLVERYGREGASCLSHGNKGMQRAWKTDEDVECMIVDLYKGKYQGFNFRHFLEKLNDVERIGISYGALYRILMEAGFKSPKGHRRKGKVDLHPTRQRRRCFGELLQADASIHRWFGELHPKAALHGAIDDATGVVMGLFFDVQETLNGYYNMLWQILVKYGIPEAFYTDNRTIFEYRKLSERSRSIDRDANIQFRRCCSQLGIELITTSSPQAKGRIERLWGTLQSRLVSELAARGIDGIEDANSFLPEFMDDFNRRFASRPDPSRDVFVEPPSEKELSYYLSVEHHRKVDNGSTFSFFGSRLQLVTSAGNAARLGRGSTIHVYRTFRDDIVAVHDGTFYETKEVLEESMDPSVKPPSSKSTWVPSPNHPWRRFVVAKSRD